jgi:hypothetical protein
VYALATRLIPPDSGWGALTTVGISAQTNAAQGAPAMPPLCANSCESFFFERSAIGPADPPHAGDRRID